MSRKKLSEIAFIKSGIDKSYLEELLDIAKNASIIGGDILQKYYGKITNISNKGTVGDLLTNADLESENKIIEYLKSKTPEFPILAEESGQDGIDKSLMWCIDPLDGTTNYAHGYPFYATSIGLCYNNLPLLGAINIPYFNEIYSSAPGLGAYCNSKRINVSTTKELINSLLVTGFAYDRREVIDNNYSEFCTLTHKTRGVRRGGAAAVDLAFVASGKLDGYWERGLAKWDLAAGVPLVEEAGGVITNYKSGDFDLSSGCILACTEGIEKELKYVLQRTTPLEGKFFKDE